MKRNYVPVVALALAVMAGGAPGYAQLPNTNMGKFVHQPGDNQYDRAAQQGRHGQPAPVYSGGGSGNMAAASANGGGIVNINPLMLMGSNVPKVDISVEPISADEPIPPGGFPPLPERLNLPVQSSMNFGRGGGGGGGNGGGGGAPAIQGVHEHYVHMAAGAYQKAASGGGDGGSGRSDGGGRSGNPDDAVPFSSSSIGGANPTRSVSSPATGHPYYKCGTAAAPAVNRGGNSETFSSNSPSDSAPRYSGATSRDVQALGKVPKLDDGQDVSAAPEAPQAAIVNQATTQDLSLPDDEFASRYALKDSTGKRMVKGVGRQVGRYGYQIMNQAGSMIRL